MYIERDNAIIDTDTGKYITNAYIVECLIKGKPIENLLYFDLNESIIDSCYYLKTLSSKVEQVQIYKNGFLIADLNKWK